jgi:hypothetical protein
VGAEERYDENLVLKGEPGKLRKGELALDRNLLLRDADTLDNQPAALGNAEQFLPVGSGFGVGIHGRRVLVSQVQEEYYSIFLILARVIIDLFKLLTPGFDLLAEKSWG